MRGRQAGVPCNSAFRSRLCRHWRAQMGERLGTAVQGEEVQQPPACRGAARAALPGTCMARKCPPESAPQQCPELYSGETAHLQTLLVCQHMVKQGGLPTAKEATENSDRDHGCHTCIAATNERRPAGRDWIKGANNVIWQCQQSVIIPLQVASSPRSNLPRLHGWQTWLAKGTVTCRLQAGNSFVDDVMLCCILCCTRGGV